MKFDLLFWTNLPFWKNASTKRKRIYSVMIVFIVSFLLVVIGSLIPINHQDATQVVDQLNQTITQNQANGTLPQYIFIQNFRISLIFFIPVVGPIFGVLSFVTTGYALGAEAQVFGFPPFLYSFFELLNPIFWVEFIVYSTAISESIWLLRRLNQRRYWELKNTAILIGICAGLLAIAAIVESMLPLV
jgi:hypothetical protein